MTKWEYRFAAPAIAPLDDETIETYAELAKYDLTLHQQLASMALEIQRHRKANGGAPR